MHVESCLPAEMTVYVIQKCISKCLIASSKRGFLRCTSLHEGRELGPNIASLLVFTSYSSQFVSNRYVDAKSSAVYTL